jgi:hypothetical protein
LESQGKSQEQSKEINALLLELAAAKETLTASTTDAGKQTSKARTTKKVEGSKSETKTGGGAAEVTKDGDRVDKLAQIEEQISRLSALFTDSLSGVGASGGNDEE